jgi:hypothetical protein
MDPIKCTICGRYSYRSPCPHCNTVNPAPEPLDYPCRNCPELPFCPDASMYALECHLLDPPDVPTDPESE